MYVYTYVYTYIYIYMHVIHTGAGATAGGNQLHLKRIQSLLQMCPYTLVLLYTQVLVALLLTINFISNAYESEMHLKLYQADGTPTPQQV